MLLLLILLGSFTAAEKVNCNCTAISLEQRLCLGSYVSHVVSRGEDVSLRTHYLRVYTVEHKKVYKNSSELPTKIVTTQKCGIKLRNGTEYLIGAWYTDYANHGLYIVKCDLRKKWNNVTEEDRDKLEKYYSSNYTCPEPVEYEDDF
ncbi:hypothetical protein Y032_0009g569 [Ancylostoma ceylanicum]|nr:hypothetical protein Y032_0009g569 [Ancylostoma ceylanicum]